MAVQRPRDPVPHTPQVRSTPDVRDLIARPLQLWHLAPANRPRRRHRLGVERQNQHAARAASAPVLGRVRIVKCPVRPVSPLVWLRRLAVRAVLVEVDEERVLEDRQVRRADFRQVGPDQERRLHRCPERKVRPRLLQREPVAHFHDVRVVVRVEVDVVEEEGVFRQDLRHPLPVCCRLCEPLSSLLISGGRLTTNVTRNSPTARNISAPARHICLSPLAQ